MTQVGALNKSTERTLPCRICCKINAGKAITLVFVANSDTLYLSTFSRGRWAPSAAKYTALFLSLSNSSACIGLSSNSSSFATTSVDPLAAATKNGVQELISFDSVSAPLHKCAQEENLMPALLNTWWLPFSNLNFLLTGRTKFEGGGGRGGSGERARLDSS